MLRERMAQPSYMLKFQYNMFKLSMYIAISLATRRNFHLIYALGKNISKADYNNMKTVYQA